MIDIARLKNVHKFCGPVALRQSTEYTESISRPKSVSDELALIAQSCIGFKTQPTRSSVQIDNSREIQSGRISEGSQLVRIRLMSG